MKKIVYFLCILPFLTGCYEDKSSDRYDPIGSITITGLEEEYSLISFRDALQITPTVTSTDPADKPADFEYLWTVYTTATSLDTPPAPDTLGQGVGAKDLDYAVVLRPGSYTVRLRATNPDNGYTVYKTAKLVVNTQFTTGYYFLKETVGGNTELDFLSPAGDLAENLLEAQLGTPITGAPTRLGFFTAYSYMDEATGGFIECKALVPMGGNDMKIMKIEDMSVIYDHRTMFYGDEPDEKPLMCFNDLFTRPIYISSKGLYTSNQQPGYGTYGTGKFGLPIAPAGGCTLSPHCVVSSGSFTTMFNFFNEQTGKLVYINYNAALQTMSSDNGIELKDYGRTLLFMGTNGWAVSQDKSTSARYLYKLSFSSGRNPITSIKELDTSLNFSKAQVYGSNKSGNTGMLYAGVGDKLYMYNTGFTPDPENPSLTPETLLSPKGMTSGEQITMITHKPSAPNTYLMIATHKDGKYKVYMYELSGGAPSGDPVTVASGQGKVVDMQYARPSVPSSYIVNY